MSGYSWISVTALFCYLLLLLTFLASKHREKVIRSFMLLMLIMILWVGGSFAMRTQLWPSINFWHHVSVAGMILVPAGYYVFIVDFLEEQNDWSKCFWLGLHAAIAAFDCATSFFVPEPVVSLTESGATQFVYNYTSNILLLVLVAMLPCLTRIILTIRRHCKGNRIASQRLRPLLYGFLALALGHLCATLPFFKGFPLDIVSGVVNVLFVFYALYQKRLFKMTVLLSHANYAAFGVTVGLLSALRVPELTRSFAEAFALRQSTATTLAACVPACAALLSYGVVELAHRLLFVRRQQRRAQVIEQLSDSVKHTFSVADILQSMTDTIVQMTRIERLLVFIRQADGGFHVEHTTNPLDEKGFYLKPDHPLVTAFQTHTDTLAMQEFVRSTAYRSMWESEKRLLRELGAECFVPLRSGEALIGLLVIPKGNSGYRDGDLLFAQSAASVCAAAVEDARVYEHAVTEARKDKRTGLINRKFFLELLEREFEHYKDTAIALCLLNVDDFKMYNQLYGTPEGDLALVRIAGVLRSALHDNCYAARVGSKEFALLLPGYDIYSAKLLAENLMVEIAGINARSDSQVPRKLTVSVGVCAAPYMASSANELLRNAETAVYTAKRSGKNAVQIYSSEIFRSKAGGADHRSGYDENSGMIYALTSAIDAKDHYTYQHSQNVAYYARELAKAANLSGDILEIVKEAGLLHDIGKIGIPEEILDKPGRLTEEEYAVMKGHVENAVNIIRYLPSLDYVIPAVLAHHERYDGRGYPQRLAGEDIPILGRILCIADSFDAMTSKRSYKSALTKEQAVEILREESGKQFDPKLALLFIELVESGKVAVHAHTILGDEHADGA